MIQKNVLRISLFYWLSLLVMPSVAFVPLTLYVENPQEVWWQWEQGSQKAPRELIWSATGTYCCQVAWELSVCAWPRWERDLQRLSLLPRSEWLCEQPVSRLSERWLVHIWVYTQDSALPWEFWAVHTDIAAACVWQNVQWKQWDLSGVEWWLWICLCVPWCVLGVIRCYKQQH